MHLDGSADDRVSPRIINVSSKHAGYGATRMPASRSHDRAGKLVVPSARGYGTAISDKRQGARCGRNLCAFCGSGYLCLLWPWLSVPSVALVIRAFRGPGYPCLPWPWLSVPSVALVIRAFRGPRLHCCYLCLLWPWPPLSLSVPSVALVLDVRKPPVTPPFLDTREPRA